MSAAPSPHTSAIQHLSPVPPFPVEEQGHRTILVAVPPLDPVALGPDPDPGAELADPRPDYVRTLATLIFEVVEGLRTAGQLGASITVSAAQQLSALRAARQEQLSLLRQLPRSVSRPGPVRIDRPSPCAAEAAAVLYTGGRGRAVALRLEWIHRRWRVTQIAVL